MSEFIKLAVMGLQEAKNFEKELKAQGVDIKLDHNEATCTRGCAVTVEVLGKEKDMEIIQRIYSENYKKLLDGLDVKPELLNAVFDPNQAEATCPACGHIFNTKNIECPDCGLALG